MVPLSVLINRLNKKKQKKKQVILLSGKAILRKHLNFRAPK